MPAAHGEGRRAGLAAEREGNPLYTFALFVVYTPFIVYVNVHSTSSSFSSCRSGFVS